MLPEAEVCNYFVWRQQDAQRNAVQMIARSMFSHKECHEKTCPDLRVMVEARGRTVDDYGPRYTRGRCIVRRQFEREGATRSGWFVDDAIPVFSDDRDYIELHLAVESEEL